MLRKAQQRVALVLVASFAAVAVACSGGDDGDGDAGEDPPDSGTSADTTSADAWRDEVVDVYERQFALFGAPDVEGLDDVYSPSCDCYDARRSTVEALVAEDLHLEGEPAEVLDLAFLDEAAGSDPGSGEPVRFTVRTQSRARYVDAAGAEVERLRLPDGPTCSTLGLVADGDGEGDGGGSGGAYQVVEEWTSGCVPEWLDTEGPEEWVDVVRDLEEREFALIHDPDPDRVADLYTEDCACYEGKVETARFLVERGEHFEGRPRLVLAVREDSAEGGSVQLTVQVRSQPVRRVDADGALVEDLVTDPDESTCLALDLVEDDDGTYRIAGTEGAPCPPEWG